MKRTLILGALTALAIGFTAPAPAEARIANPALSAAESGNVEQAQYYYGGPRRGYYGRDRYRSRHHWRGGHAYSPRRCWTQRIVRWDGRVSFVRRCR